ncbi:hypothetical protein MHYP_G00147250 [Metynnis hypsauchen]
MKNTPGGGRGIYPRNPPNPVQSSSLGGDRTNKQVIPLPPQIGSPQRHQSRIRTAMNTAERYRTALCNKRMGRPYKEKKMMRRMSLFPRRGTSLGNLGLTEEEIREEVENDTYELVSEFVKLPNRARIQAIRSLPMNFSERRNIRSRVISIKLSEKNILPTCCTDCNQQVSLFFRRFGAGLTLVRQRLVIWQDTLKEIGGRFGTSVLSYFQFLKWLLMFNIFSLLINFCFITIPQIVHSPNITHPISFRGLELLTGVGYFNQTVFFYGGYNGEVIKTQPSYNMQLAYLFTIAAYLVLCGVSLIYSMARSFQRNFVLVAGPAYGGAWRLLCSWDFSVINERAIQHNKDNLSIQLKESLSERLQKKAVVSVSAKLQQVSLQLLAWLLSLGLAVCSCAGIYFLELNLNELIPSISDSGNLEEEASTLLMPVVVSLINLVIPLIYALVNKMEHYTNPRTNVYVIILRNVLLKMSILGILCYYWLSDVPTNFSCWESFVGQSVYRLVVVDFIFCLLGSFFTEFLLNIIGTKCIRSLGVPEFDVATNVLNLIYAQTLAWIGIYFSPLLPIIQVVKLFIIFYLKKVSLSMNCQPPKRTGRAAQMQTVYVALLFFPSFIGALSMVAYTVWSLKPSEQCGPFQNLSTPFQVVHDWMKYVQNIPGSEWAWWIFEHVLRNELFFYLITLIVLVFTYFVWQVSQGRKQLIKTLREQIVNEGKDKAFLLNRLQNAQKQKRDAVTFRPQIYLKDEGGRRESAAGRFAERESVVKPQREEKSGLARATIPGTPSSQPPRDPRRPLGVQPARGQRQSPRRGRGSLGRGRAAAQSELPVEDESPALDSQPVWPVRILGNWPHRHTRLEPLPVRDMLLPGVVPETQDRPSSGEAHANGPGSGQSAFSQPNRRPSHYPDRD